MPQTLTPDEQDAQIDFLKCKLTRLQRQLEVLEIEKLGAEMELKQLEREKENPS